MGGLRHIRIKATVHGMEVFRFTQKKWSLSKQFLYGKSCTVFWDRKRVLLVEFLPHNETINAAVYCETLNNLCHSIYNKRSGKLSKGIILLHDNARPHEAKQIKDLITSFQLETLDHSPYSPDLAPSDYHLFLHWRNTWTVSVFKMITKSKQLWCSG